MARKKTDKSAPKKAAAGLPNAYIAGSGIVAEETITDTLDDHRSNADIQSSGSKVVQEEERLSALGDNIVDGHSNEIDTDGVVLVHGEGELGSEKDPAGHTFNLVPTPSSPETRRVSAAW